VNQPVRPGSGSNRKRTWTHIGNHIGDARKWIYLVTFKRQYSFEGQEFEARGTLTIPVLLDGRVIVGQKSEGFSIESGFAGFNSGS
jgi:hypothetical protein